ncbi:MAG TPA: hypothetical protein VN428_11860, partial [Bryobacteraceae bacterium]|nr:hypothetical protein [Bryobacteraceae bacterium]
PVPPNFNWLLLLIILFGSSKIIMGSNKTRIWCKGLSGLTGEAEQAVGCCMIPCIPFSLNLQCWDFQTKKLGSVGAPMLTDIVVAPNTVQVGINFSDYLAAMMDWAIDIVLAVVMAAATTGGSKAWDAHSAAKVTKAGDKAAAKALKEGADEAAVKAAREAAEKAAAKRGTLSTLYHKIADTRYGKKFLIGLGLKLPYKLLVKNTEWYREGIQHPIERKLPNL